MTLYPCPRCATPILATVQRCPHCHTGAQERENIRPLSVLLMGLMLSGCGDKDDTGGQEDSGPISQPEYGVAEVEDSNE